MNFNAEELKYLNHVLRSTDSYTIARGREHVAPSVNHYKLMEKIKMNEHNYLSNPLLTEYRDSNFPNKNDMGEEQPLYKSVISYDTKESDWNDFWEEK